MDPKKLFLNVAGGGSRGSIQLGMLKCVKDLNIVPDEIVCASVGALNGALFVQGDLAKLESLWLGIANQQVYNFYPWDVLTKNYLLDSSPLKKTIDSVVDFKKLRASKIPLHVVVTNLTDWTTESYTQFDLNEEDFKTILFASASPPMAFAPVTFRGKTYCDGGIINNMGISNAVLGGATTIIVLTPTVKEETPTRNELDMLNIMTSVPEYCYLDRELTFLDKINQLQAAFPDEVAREIKHILVRPPAPTGLSLLDFNYPNKAKWIQYGYDLAKSVLGKIDSVN